MTEDKNDAWKTVDTMYENPGTLSAQQSTTLKEFWTILLLLFSSKTNLKAEWVKLFPPRADEDADALLQQNLLELTGDMLRDEFYKLLRSDYADFLPLRFLRARSYDQERAATMLVNALAFRRKNIPKAMMSEVNATDEFLEAMRKGKSFVPCYDSHGRSITCIRMKNHVRGDCSLDCFERYILYQMEHAHLLHQPLQDRTVLLVDMTGFSITSLDISAIKFLILNFEQYYPEELYEGIIHNAPWLFSGAWACIKPLLRQATRDKITFTSNVRELAAKIGDSEAEKVLTTQMQYIPRPVDEVFKDESKDLSSASEEYKAALASWTQQIIEFEESTREWARPPASDTPLEHSQSVESKRAEIAWRLSETYWRIDPFIRPKSYYDRAGLLPPASTNSLTLKKEKTNSTSS